MKEIDRRSVLTGILCGAAIATVGLTVMPKPRNPCLWVPSRLVP